MPYGCQQIMLHPDRDTQAILEYLCTESNSVDNCSVYYARQLYFKINRIAGRAEICSEMARSKRFCKVTGVFKNLMANDELTKAGTPRRRCPGAGRPPKHGEETRSVRVPVSVPTELVSAIPELQAILDHWEADLAANPNSERRYYARKIIDEIRALGY